MIKHDMGGQTLTDEAFNAVPSLFASSRDGVPKVVVLLTDGASTYYERTIKAAENVKANGIKIIAVGIGNKVHILTSKAIFYSMEALLT